MTKAAKTYIRALARLVAGALLLCPGPAFGSNFNDFLPGAKAMGMGMAFSAVADDPSAMFFNPAGTANTPYAQAGSSLGRMNSPVGTMSFMSMTYLRPYEPINTATVGAAYYAGRQTNGGDRDVFLFHYAQEVKLPALYLTKPLKVGGNFKFLNIDRAGPGNFGVGFDGGVLARSSFGLSGSFSVLDFTTNTGVPSPIWVFGTAYTWRKWLTLAGDFRAHRGLSEFYPGLEAAFHHGLLKARVGRGFQLDGIGQVAFGLGVNFSPVILDVAMTLPTAGIHKQGGSYQATLNYRFGAPSFAGNYVGQAAGQAQSLRTDINLLEDRKKTLETETDTVSTNRAVAEGELRVLEKRVTQLQETYRQLQKKRDEVDYELNGLQIDKKNLTPVPPPPKPKPRAPSKPLVLWPQRHAVQAGDTLRALSQRYYADPALWEQIYDANRDKIERGLPKENAVLTIPEARR